MLYLSVLFFLSVFLLYSTFRPTSTPSPSLPSTQTQLIATMSKPSTTNIWTEMDYQVPEGHCVFADSDGSFCTCQRFMMHPSNVTFILL
jgi:hypothetical protein